jgi:hypothetical protein
MTSLLSVYIVVLHTPFFSFHFHALEGMSSSQTDPLTRLPSQESVNIHMAQCLRAIED